MIVTELDVFSGNVEMRVPVIVISGSVVIWLVGELALAATSLVPEAQSSAGRTNRPVNTPEIIFFMDWPFNFIP